MLALPFERLAASAECAALHDILAFGAQPWRSTGQLASKRRHAHLENVFGTFIECDDLVQKVREQGMRGLVSTDAL